ncbi:phage terminase small subunit [Desulfosporosinus youngiae]|uniref:PBSX phage terminase small subunit-like N-terminal domain-containing protein n=1 Tax=Desulfosporosinus youngiae DSM 17734 TaxID=768710 RepID=H5XZW1_9FIRM|nr:phage terminase small subunit [Desulfosporosinus youngiae]EHQ92157.1 hypothetical protein DesyoDRAFT_5226 [Desulfosporosinus youngiae DSM 17734]
MPKERSPDRAKAFELYREHQGKIDLVDIAGQLNLPAGTIRGWKNKDKWEEQLNGTLQKNTERSKRKQGGQPNNKNAKGHGAPARNKNAETHGLFTKYLPAETLELMESLKSRSSLDILWDQITIQYAAIIRSQLIMDVTGKDEMIKELKRSYEKTTDRSTAKTNSTSQETEYEYEFQFAWDRQATFLKAQSRAMGELRSMIKQYDELLKSGLATEEQELRISKLKTEIDIMKGGGQGNDQEGINSFIKATKMSEAEIAALFENEEGDSDGMEDIQKED